MRGWIGIAAVLVFGLAFLMGGMGPFGRVLMGFGLPSLAAPFFSDPHWRGVAMYQAGDHAKAAAAFEEAGPIGFYNLGNALTQAQDYAAALEAYDLALAVYEDVDARENFDLVRAFYAGTPLDAASVAVSRKREGDTVQAPIARGDARASGTGDETTNAGTSLAMPALQSEDQIGVRRVFDDAFIVANDRWLKTLEDVPGAFLAARINHAFKARRKAGTGQISQETEW